MSKVTPEQQAMQNVINRDVDPALLTVNLSAIEQAAAERRAKEEAAQRAANPQDPAEVLRGEYLDLERRVKGQPTEKACKTYAAEQERVHADAVKKIDDEISYVKSLLDSPGVTKCVALRQGREPMRDGQIIEGCSCDVHVFRRKIRALEIQLRRAKNEADKSIRVCGGMIRSAQETDLLRPRLAELEKMFRKIDKARQVARGVVKSDMQQLPIAQGDGFRSRHIQWEGNTPHQK